MVEIHRQFEWRQLDSPGTALDVLADSRRRLRVLLASFIVLSGIVLLRAAVLEATQGEAFLQSIDVGHSLVEPLPAPRGRLLARDGSVLACDELTMALAVEYRYLEDPPDESWLRSLARRRLGAAARDPQTRVAEIARLRVEIVDLRRRLAALCGLSQAEWQARAARIQQRVAAIDERVNQRRARGYRRQLNTDATDSADDNSADEGSWAAAVRLVLGELFSPADLPPPRIDVVEERQRHTMTHDLPLAVVAEIESHPDRYPGVAIERSLRRRYPQGPLAAHVVGYVGAAETPNGDGHSPPRRVGRTGAELAAERWLRGSEGIVRRTLDSRGRVVHSSTDRQPLAGRDVILSIDAGVQRTAERLLDDFQRDRPKPPRGTAPPADLPGGAVVVLDVRTGAVLAAASAPRFDPGLFAAADSQQVAQLLHDHGHPLLDRTAQMAIPPGSVFKTVTAIALLQSDAISPDLPFECRGYLREPGSQRCLIYRRYGVGHGPVTLADAIAQSCNVYFYHHATKLGPGPLVEWAARLGFGQRTLCDWCRDVQGNLPSPREARERGLAWRDADTQETAIGQGRLTATPLQVARLMAAIANGGRLVTPHVLKDLGLSAEGAAGNGRDSQAESTDDSISTPPARSVPDLKPETIARLRKALAAVVSDPRGTGYATVRLAAVPIAGKTGTAETGSGRGDHAWFAGYAPADEPRVAFAIALERGGGGGEAAGPLARQLVRYLADNGFFNAAGR